MDSPRRVVPRVGTILRGAEVQYDLVVIVHLHVLGLLKSKHTGVECPALVVHRGEMTDIEQAVKKLQAQGFQVDIVPVKSPGNIEMKFAVTGGEQEYCFSVSELCRLHRDNELTAAGMKALAESKNSCT